MKQTILDWSDQNIWDHLWRWSTLTGPVILVIQTGMSLFIWQKSIVVPSTAHLYCASLTITHTKFKCVVAWIGTAQLEYTLPLDMWNFQNFKLDYFWEWKVPRISASEVIWYACKTFCPLIKDTSSDLSFKIEKSCKAFQSGSTVFHLKACNKLIKYQSDELELTCEELLLGKIGSSQDKTPNPHGNNKSKSRQKSAKTTSTSNMVKVKVLWGSNL